MEVAFGETQRQGLTVRVLLDKFMLACLVAKTHEKKKKSLDDRTCSDRLSDEM